MNYGTPNQMVFPFIMPMQGGGQDNLRNHLPFNDPPARVKVALAYLQSLTDKTAERGWAGFSSLGIEITEGQKLTPREHYAQHTACDMLASYFKGDLQPTEWEKLQMRAIEVFIKLEEDGGSVNDLGEGKLLTCPGCGQVGKIRPNCIICKGSGQLLCYPVAPSQQQGESSEG